MFGHVYIWKTKEKKNEKTKRANSDEEKKRLK